MSNGDSLDNFVFPPFIPTASARPAEAPPAAPQPPAQSEPPASPEAAEASGGRMTMPWDLETPIVRDDEPARAPQPAESAADDAADDGEDLPWLEVPTPRETAPDEPAAAPPAAAEREEFPDWMAWDEAAEQAAEAEMRDSVAPVAGLEDFVPMDDLGGFIAPAPAVDWAEAEPPAPAQPAGFDPAEDAFPEPDFDALLAPSDVDADAPVEASAGADFDALLAPSDTGTAARSDETDAFLSPADAPAEALAAEDWSLDAPAAPQVGDELEVEVTLDEVPAESAAEASPQPFVADEEAVMAAEPAPSAAVEPDPFTAATVTDAESAETGAEGSPFDDVADRLEAIARMLRDRPDELLAGGSNDPLALLVTGYVMGYTARGR